MQTDCTECLGPKSVSDLQSELDAARRNLETNRQATERLADKVLRLSGQLADVTLSHEAALNALASERTDAQRLCSQLERAYQLDRAARQMEMCLRVITELIEENPGQPIAPPAS